MDYELIKAERFDDLRKVWPNEAHHFTHWVVDEGLSILEKEIGIEISNPQREVLIGSKRADIVADAIYEGNKVKVIIENQLEATNHDHLGKIVTYAAGKDASVVIWIVEKATIEYRKAVEWLNRRTGDDIDFYLVEIQLWEIGQKSLLPRFNVICRPSPKDRTKLLSESEERMVGFWEEFNNYADSIPKMFFSPENFNSKRKPYPQPNYDLHINGYKNLYVYISIQKTKKQIKCGIYFPDDKLAYNSFENHSEEIRQIMKGDIEWYDGKKKASSISVCREYNEAYDEASQNMLYSWLCDTALKWKDIIKKYGK